jgi:hypothetical protein
VTIATDLSCPQCERPRKPWEPWCFLCGHVFERPPSERAAGGGAPFKILPRLDEDDEEPQENILGLPEPWFFLVVGLLTAPVFAVTPFLHYMGWFLSSLTHEMGHATIGWVLGCPSFPAISLGGHAAAFHKPQILFLVGAIAFGLGWGAWRIEPQRVRVPALILVVGTYLAVALTPIREVLFLLGGHTGELVFAAVFLWRTMTGGFTAHLAERVLFGTLGAYLLGSNLILTTQLMFSETARRAYAGSGSFGLTNDYIRLADDVFGIPLPLVAGIMTCLALGVIPLAFFFARFARAD